jgi:hypothetical protein
MSFAKSLFLAILATLFLTYVFGTSINELLGVNIYMDGELVEPFQAISFAALIGVVLVIVAIAIVLSVFGSVLFMVMLIVGTIALSLMGVFWPVLLLALFIYWLTREPKTA